MLVMFSLNVLLRLCGGLLLVEGGGGDLLCKGF